MCVLTSCELLLEFKQQVLMKFTVNVLCSIYRQLQQQQQAELEVHQRDGLTAYDLSQVHTHTQTQKHRGKMH